MQIDHFTKFERKELTEELNDVTLFQRTLNLSVLSNFAIIFLLLCLLSRIFMTSHGCLELVYYFPDVY